MKSGKTGKAPRRRFPAGVAYSREFLERLARILVHTGHSPQKLSREFADICKGLKEPTTPWDPARLNFVSDLPHVIAHWHSDPQYVDPEGRPIPLPVRARGPSMTALIGVVSPSRNAAEVIETLVALRAVRRRGSFYVPTDRYLAFNQQRTTALAHGLDALLGMLRTVERNVPGRGGNTVLERAAINPRFPISALPAFHRRLKRVAAEFLFSVDADMRRREVARESNLTTRLGVGVFAFEDPPIAGPSRGGTGRTSVRRVSRRTSRPGGPG
jgi:hypothetical protein